ncbi:MAG TPA: hypothetical protein VE075_05825 [Thermoanaerobaculia bacterium]|nr:hypothetical protein [Thermoanaerobaculia bacterium]
MQRPQVVIPGKPGPRTGPRAIRHPAGRRWRAALLAALAPAAALAGLAAGAPPAAAQLTVDVQAGTLGIGGGLAWPLAPQLAVRVSGNALGGINRSERAGGNRYQVHLDLGNAAALLDWHPAANGFRLSAGAMYDANRVEGDSEPSGAGTYVIGNLQLPASLVGTLHGKVDYPSFAPYAGLGWGTAPGAGPGFGVNVDLGVAFVGRPRVTLTPEPPPGSPLNSPAAMALLAPELAREEARVEQKIDGYRYYPVLAVGVAYRF